MLNGILLSRTRAISETLRSFKSVFFTFIVGSNLIKNVQEGDLDHFKSIVEINFREMKDVSAKTKEYLEKVKSGKTGKRRIIVISLYEDKVYKK